MNEDVSSASLPETGGLSQHRPGKIAPEKPIRSPRDQPLPQMSRQAQFSSVTTL
jgi:hypothetical protein